mmetsp:Transcript_9513/g.23239  ORF Transcript_9513/g.23239 Transcript_9513/m.23239 type:complete len:111 (+) Transcript_9513:380-712(+)
MLLVLSSLCVVLLAMAPTTVGHNVHTAARLVARSTDHRSVQQLVSCCSHRCNNAAAGLVAGIASLPLDSLMAPCRLHPAVLNMAKGQAVHLAAGRVARVDADQATCSTAR